MNSLKYTETKCLDHVIAPPRLISALSSILLLPPPDSGNRGDLSHLVTHCCRVSAQENERKLKVILWVNMTSEVRRYNNDDLDAGPSQSLWSCIKNSVRRKKCTCHLVSMGRWLTLHWQKRRTVCKNEALLLVSFFVVVVIYLVLLSQAASEQSLDLVQQISALW